MNALELSELRDGEDVRIAEGTRAFLVRVRDDGTMPWKVGCGNCRQAWGDGIAAFIERALRGAK